MDSIIPDDVRRFVFDKIDSVAQLEAVLLLRSDPEQKWTVETLAKRLYISERETADLLAKLCTEGLCGADSNELGPYNYRPVSSDLEILVDRLAEIYSKHLVPVTNLIHSKPKTRIQEFADAFRLRKDE